MKTQISNLRSGTKNQILNPQIDYTALPNATSHLGHSGTNQNDVEKVWKQVIAENPQKMKICVGGVEVDLTANWSISHASVKYWGYISVEDMEEKFHLKAAKKKTPSISVQCGNIVLVSNGKKGLVHICPSLIEIL